MKRAFLDTGYLIALNAFDDQHHDAAQRHWQDFLKERPFLITTSYIFDEVTTFFNTRDRHAKAVEIGKLLLQSQSITFHHVDKDLFEAGWKNFQIYSDKRYSLTDCISFETMERERIRHALSFDDHFEQAGYINLPLL
jgi:uncharacterized protein